MSLEIKGINSLMNKLNKLSNINTKKAVEEVADTVEFEIRVSASSFSDTEAKYIAKCEAREGERSYFVDIGLKNDNAPFELWKGLWYQNWGYFNYGWNFKGQYYIKPHQLWFNEAVNRIEGSTLQKMKSNLRKEIKKAME